MFRSEISPAQSTHVPLAAVIFSCSSIVRARRTDVARIEIPRSERGPRALAIPEGVSGGIDSKYR